ncbi:hypothetical protein [Maridesulfovibrio salexigens]|uniref:Methyltransferase domain-containing protein n=1 Tax=Maridesulfovibrio salexigens (strain ATCC 14822 / DSM 2638 / NCIMB 8403 / VKM B-1763) TaxID=526222 RepID=C6BXU5_MARSD|nr:hypothetical protein [Maridesulfovibrio salexigens]ACS78653.1 conserved hypothetical protein [Maridesulfovibrio salexigens DSM 2638]
MDFSIVVLSNPDSIYWRSIEDVIYPLRDAISALGYSVDIAENKISKDAVNIIFGLQDKPNYPLQEIPDNSIIYNFEQIVKGSKALRPHYIESLCKFTVWEYSKRNVETLERNFNATKVHHVPLGHVPQMQCIDENYPKDIDVLFYGAMNPRRQEIIRQLQQRGIKVKAIERVFGHERNFYIARSKIVLNMHYYTPGIFEEVRNSFLFANKKTVVCERNEDTTVPSRYEESCCFAPYEELADTIEKLLDNQEKCLSQGEQGFSIFSKMSYPEILAEVTRKAVPSPSQEVNIPKRFNAGSGKDFMEGYLNVDINPAWTPDILLDLSADLDHEKTYKTKRFGNITLPKNYFEEIIANDVLEHVPDLILTMTNFLELLCEGGRLKVQVPYDLSYGAWQDPTHVRAFNEMSLRYYTDWCWYVGWRDYRFFVKDLSYVPSDLGKQMHQQQQSLEKLLHTPRAIDSMTVTLEKRRSTPEEQRDYDLRHRTFYK